MKSIRFSAVALLAFFLSACETADDAKIPAANAADSRVISLFDPVGFDTTTTAINGPIVPFPNTALFVLDTSSGQPIPTGVIRNLRDESNPFTTAVSKTDGFSTSYAAFADFTGQIDADTLDDVAPGPLPAIIVAKIIFDGAGNVAAPPQLLVQGVDFSAELSAAIQGRSRIKINWLKPLDSRSFYAVLMTSVIKGTNGVPAEAGDLLKIVRSATSVQDQIAAIAAGTLVNPSLQAMAAQAASANPAIRGPAQVQIGTLESLRGPLATLIAGAGVPEQVVVHAWTFQTQHLNITLPILEARAEGIGALDIDFDPVVSAQDTGSFIGPSSEVLRQNATTPGPSGVNVYQGTLKDLPYYLTNADQSINDPLTKFWENDGTRAADAFRFAGTDVPCNTGAPVDPNDPNANQVIPKPESTTVCFPTPVEKSKENIPILVGVPSNVNDANNPLDDTNVDPATIGRANGFPVAIFVHGITRSRTNMLAVMNSLAQAGIVTVAIDLPLHGIDPSDSSVSAAQVATFGTNIERNFGLANSNPFLFANLESPLTTRDNIRQGAIDIVHLSKSLASLNQGELPNGATGALDGNFAVDVNNVFLFAHSLGGIVGTVALSIDAQNSAPVFDAAVLANTGGGLLKLFDGSQFFGPQLSSALAAAGSVRGTDAYELALLLGQTALDDADPVNYAGTITQPVLLMEVLNDDTVPNKVVVGDPGTDPGQIIGGTLSGTEPLAALLGAAPPIDVVVPAALAGGAPNALTKLNIGTHGSVLDPSAVPLATVELQRQAATFLGSGGVQFQIGSP